MRKATQLNESFADVFRRSPSPIYLSNRTDKHRFLFPEMHRAINTLAIVYISARVYLIYIFYNFSFQFIYFDLFRSRVHIIELRFS